MTAACQCGNLWAGTKYDSGVLAAREHSTIIDARLQAYVTTSNVVVIYGWATLKARAVAHGIKTYAPLCARLERCSLADGTSLFFKVPLVRSLSVE
jgi:hypothetical protein